MVDWKKLDIMLYEFIESKKDTDNIKNLSIKFVQTYPEYNLRAENVRTRYYYLLNKLTLDDLGSRFKPRAWTPEEDKELLLFIEENKYKATKQELFVQYSSRVNRHPKAISSHYHTIIKKMKEMEKDKQNHEKKTNIEAYTSQLSKGTDLRLEQNISFKPSLFSIPNYTLVVLTILKILDKKEFSVMHSIVKKLSAKQLDLIINFLVLVKQYKLNLEKKDN